MSCNHKRVWEDATVVGRGKADELLAKGWEPMNYERNFMFHFKRQKPCEECEKVAEAYREWNVAHPDGLARRGEKHCAHGWPESMTRRCEECDPA